MFIKARLSALLFLLTLGTQPSWAQLVISEIMYNPASSDSSWEFVEIYNASMSPVDLTGYVFSDDDVIQSAANIASGSIPANGSAILYNADDLTATNFSDAWGTGMNLVAVTNFPALGNSGDRPGLWDSFANYNGGDFSNAVVEVFYENNANGWPDDNGNGSIYLNDLDTDASVGGNWTLSSIDTVTPVGTVYQSANAGGNSGSDVASPGGTLDNSGGGEGEPCTDDITPIYAIQGNGSSATVTGAVTTRGVVIADFEGPSPTLRGFYIQDADGDGDTTSSDGLFVFNGDNDDVSVGDLVGVIGDAGEFFDQTQISATTVAVCSSGNTLPAPAAVTMPYPSSDYLEQFEGMRVQFPDDLVVTETFRLGRFGQLTLSSGGRLFQPTAVAMPGAPAQAVADANNLNRILLDDALQNQNPEPVIYPTPDGLSFNNPVRSGDTVSNLVGVLTYTWGGNSASPNDFRIRPEVDPSFSASNPRPESPDDVGGRLKVASFNVLNYFVTIDDGSDQCGPPDNLQRCRGADSQEEFDRQRPKLLNALQTLDADILGLVELENNGSGASSAIQDLVDGLNQRGIGTYAIAPPPETYVGTDVIRVGIIYRTEAVALVDSSTVEILDDSDLPALNLTGPIFDGPNTSRASLAASFAENSSGEVFTVVVNHFKSKGCSDATGANTDQGDFQGCYNQRRLESAQALLAWLETHPTGVDDPDVLITGDLNAYTLEDPIQALVDAGYVHLSEEFGGATTYGYVFDEQWGHLDYIMASASMLPQVTGATDWHINADEPIALDYNTEFQSAAQQALFYGTAFYRTSDHDPVLIGLEPSPPGPLIFSDGFEEAP